MFDRFEPALKAVCLALAALLVFQCSRLVVHRDPLAKVTIPAVPALAGASTGDKATNSVPVSAKAGTNANAVRAGGAESVAVKAGTNTTSKPSPTRTDTNALMAATPAKLGTNPAAVEISAKTGTNGAPAGEPGKGATNSVAKRASGKPGTNSGDAVQMAAARSNGSRPARAGGRSGPGGPGGPGAALQDLPEDARKRVERIYQSEIFGPIQRPVPAALMGIAGDMAFLRTSSGMSGMVKEGGELGGMKLLKVGVNRVLVKEGDEEPREMMIYNGFGGESLKSKP